jgi:membrane associated rhomboid family serine protease
MAYADCCATCLKHPRHPNDGTVRNEHPPLSPDCNEVAVIPIRSAVPYRNPPIATWALILANSFVFLLQLGLAPPELEDLFLQFGLVPARYAGTADLTPGDLLPFITMMFLHGGWLHIILNMWILWLFGPAIEDRLGPGRYLAFYFACGVIAAFAHLITNPTSGEPAIGASGAIAGVLGCYMRLFPLARVIVLVPIIFIPLFFEVHAFVFVGLWFLIQLVQGAVALSLPAAGDDVAWWAHVGGFIAGFALGPLLRVPGRYHRPYYPDEGVLGFDTAGRRQSF